MDCEYCKKIFSSKTNLRVHQNSAKYCINLRNNKESEDDKQKVDEKKVDFNCNFCQKSLFSKFRLNQHLKTCKEKIYQTYEEQLKTLKRQIELSVETEKKLINDKYELEAKCNNAYEYISKLETQVKELQSQIIDLAYIAIEKPSNVTNNTHNSNNTTKMIDNRVLNMVPMDLTKESITRALEEKFTEQHLLKGQKGVAEFCVESILVTPEKKYLMKCTNASRKMFMLIDENGNQYKDINASKLTQLIYQPVKDVGAKIVNEIPEMYPDDPDRVTYARGKLIEITNINNDNTEFVKSLIPPLLVTK